MHIAQWRVALFRCTKSVSAGFRRCFAAPKPASVGRVLSYSITSKPVPRKGAKGGMIATEAWPIRQALACISHSRCSCGHTREEIERFKMGVIKFGSIKLRGPQQERGTARLACGACGHLARRLRMMDTGMRLRRTPGRMPAGPTGWKLCATFRAPAARHVDPK